MGRPGLLSRIDSYDIKITIDNDAKLDEDNIQGDTKNEILEEDTQSSYGLSVDERRGMFQHFEEVVDGLDIKGVKDAFGEKECYKAYRKKIINDYDRFVERKDKKIRDKYFDKLAEREVVESKTEMLIKDAIKLYDAKRNNKICLLNDEGQLEVKDDKLPDVACNDNNDLPEAEF